MLVKHWHRIIGGIGIGTVVALLIILTFAKLAQFANDVILSMLPQAATTAIALPVSAGIGGIKELTSLAVILNGVIIYALGNKFLKLFRITNPIARGLALGTSGHIRCSTSQRIRTCRRINGKYSFSVSWCSCCSSCACLCSNILLKRKPKQDNSSLSHCYYRKTSILRLITGI